MTRRLNSSSANLPRIVVLGAGFGGLALIRGLAVSPAFITVIDKTNHNLFQPLLYQVATAALAPSDIAVPVRGVFTDMKRVGTLMGEVTGVDTDRKVVLVKDLPDIPYDYLVLATGSVYSWFRAHDEWSKTCACLENPGPGPGAARQSARGVRMGREPD